MSKISFWLNHDGVTRHKKLMMLKNRNIIIQKIASAGTRNRAARLAGEHSTTEPPMLVKYGTF